MRLTNGGIDKHVGTSNPSLCTPKGTPQVYDNFPGISYSHYSHCPHFSTWLLPFWLLQWRGLCQQLLLCPMLPLSTSHTETQVKKLDYTTPLPLTLQHPLITE